VAVELEGAKRDAYASRVGAVSGAGRPSRATDCRL
jgi:hypothetical protein